MAAKRRIPVTMYHSINRPLTSWIWGHLIIPIDMFRKQIELLASHEYRFINLDEYRERKEAGRAGLEPEVVLTFDDGYLDNWVFAYPLMKKLGACGTIYVNPDFIDPSEEPRPNLEDYWAGRCSVRDLPAHGFLNRAELRIMQQSGIVTIGSHSLTHTWYPTSGRISDFHRPGLDTPWLAWEARPDRKPFYLTEDQAGMVPWGTPIYENDRSLGVLRCKPDPTVTKAAVEFVAGNGGSGFFASPEWQQRLREALPDPLPEPEFETEEDQDNRFRDEIAGSKTALEEILGAEVRHFCWPGGMYCPKSWDMAEAAGYRTICVARHDRKRWAADKPHYVLRAGSGNLLFTPLGRFSTEDPTIMYLICERERGAAWNPWIMRSKKVMAMIKSGFRPD